MGCRNEISVKLGMCVCSKSGVRFRKYIDNVSMVNPWEKLECVFIQMSF